MRYERRSTLPTLQGEYLYSQHVGEHQLSSLAAGTRTTFRCSGTRYPAMMGTMPCIHDARYQISFPYWPQFLAEFQSRKAFKRGKSHPLPPSKGPEKETKLQTRAGCVREAGRHSTGFYRRQDGARNTLSDAPSDFVDWYERVRIWRYRRRASVGGHVP